MGAIEKVGLLAGFSLFSVLLHAREGRADGSTIFPMEEAGSRPAGPEQPGEYGGPCGSWWPPGEERAASRAKVLRFLPMGSVGQENS